MPFYEKQPYIQPVHALIAEVLDGNIRVPDFQRPSIWRAEQRGDLLDSIYRGFPIGTLLLWSGAPPDLDCFEEVGGLSVKSDQTSARLVLDGHQRLATLVQILGPGLVEPEPAARAERWYFNLDKREPGGKVLDSRERFIVLNKPDAQPEQRWLPLSLLLSRPRLNRWARENELSDRQLQQMDTLRDLMREYALPVAVLTTSKLDEATESFKRVNFSGTPLGHVHMASALAYPGKIRLRDEFARLFVEKLEPLGWNTEDIDDETLLRVIAGLVEGQHPARLSVTAVAEALKKDRGLVGQAFDFASEAAVLLIEQGVTTPRMLPYTWQFITLALAWDRLKTVSAKKRARATRIWFLRTTYGGVFAGSNTAIYNRARDALIDLVNGGNGEQMERDQLQKVSEMERFDYRAARARICALAMAEFQDNGTNGKAHDVLGAEGSDAMRVVKRGGGRATWWHRAIVSAGDLKTAREALVSPDIVPEDSHLHRALGLDLGSLKRSLDLRRKAIIDIERKWVEEAGLQWSEEPVPTVDD